MTYLVDANVLSEPTRAVPAPAVVTWLRSVEASIVIDPIVLGEIRFGIHLLPTGRRRRRLEDWFERGIVGIRCLPWDAETGLRWARLLADLRRKGLAMPIKDSMIAATALQHRCVIATRNVRDFRIAGVDVFDPFAMESGQA